MTNLQTAVEALERDLLDALSAVDQFTMAYTKIQSARRRLAALRQVGTVNLLPRIDADFTGFNAPQPAPAPIPTFSDHEIKVARHIVAVFNSGGIPNIYDAKLVADALLTARLGKGASL